MMQTELEMKTLMCDIGRRVYANGFVAANDGNFSVKLNENTFLCTPTGVSKGDLTLEMICMVDRNCRVISAREPYRPSSEIKMHMRVYNERPDVNAVVHAHPPYATAFAIAGIPLTQPIMPEAVIYLGCVPIAEYGTPSTDEIPDAVSPYLQHFDALLLANHGALTYGVDLTQAYFRLESLEFYAKLLFLARQLGGPAELNDAQVARLYELRKSFGLPGKHPAELCLGGQCAYPCHKEKM